jgi:hypothetical protein
MDVWFCILQEQFADQSEGSIWSLHSFAHAKTESAPEAPGTAATLWGFGADGWQFPRLKRPSVTADFVAPRNSRK